MAGLTLGSFAVAFFAQKSGARGSESAWPGLLLLSLLAALGLVTGWLIGSHAVTGLAATTLLLFAGGLLVAAVFCHASLRRLPDQRTIISPLYSADLLGGAVGSLVASLLLIPAGGLVVSGLVVAGVALLALLLL
jgi:hypothetical protein